MPSSPPSAVDSAPVTETVRLSGVGFGYAATHRALRDVNLTLPAGSFHFLTGPSGAGKSSLLRLLTLVDRPTTGTIRLFGADVSDIDRRDIPAFRRRMGVVFQDFRLLDHLSAFDNAALPLRLAGGREADYAADVEEMLKWVGLGRRMDARPPALSGGEKQRLAIARALFNHPPILIFDEATSQLDAQSEHLITEAIDRLRATRTVILVAHRLSTVRLAHRIALIQEGRIVETGNHDELLQKSPLYRRFCELQLIDVGAVKERE